MFGEKMDISKRLSMLTEIQRKQFFESMANQGIDISHMITCNRTLYLSPKKSYYLMSPSQKMFYLLSKTDKSGILYNMVLLYQWKGNLDIERLKNSFDVILKKYSIFRTSFHYEDGQFIQKIHDQVKFDLYYECVDTWNQKEEIACFVKPFDFEVPPLLRAKVVKVNSGYSYLLIDVHHCLADEITLNMIMLKLSEYYNNHSKINEENVTQFIDYSEWYYNQFVNSYEYECQQNFWRDLYKTFLDEVEQPVYQNEKMDTTTKATYVTQAIGDLLYKKIRQFCMNHKLSTPMFYTGVYIMFLSLYQRKTDYIITMPVTTRKTKDTQFIMGCMLNMLPIRIQYDMDMLVAEYFNSIKHQILLALTNNEYAFEDICSNFQMHTGKRVDHLTKHNIVFANMSENTYRFGNVELHPVVISNPLPQHDFAFEIVEGKETTNVGFSYNHALFSSDIVDLMKENLNSLLKNIFIGGTRWTIKDLLHASNCQAQRMLSINTNYQEIQHKSIIDLFKMQVQMNSQNYAVISNNDICTYQQLDAYSNQVANYLLEKIKTPQTLIGVCMSRNVSLIATILGVLKAGMVYVPIDKNLPIQRIIHMQQSCVIDHIITDNKTIGELFPNTIEYQHMLSRSSVFHTFPLVSWDNLLCYLIFTSGSAGLPKGVAIEHYSLVNFIESMQKLLPINECHIFLGVTSVAFDISLLEIFLCLTTGKQLVLTNDRERTDPKSIIKLIKFNNVDFLQFTPSLLNVLLLYDPDATFFQACKCLLVGGEPFPEKLKTMLLQKNMKVFNVYGPTETTIWSSIKQIFENEPITIGTPIANTALAICKENELLPIGAIGEICIGGQGLARGYLNNVDLTNERFIRLFERQEKFYRTGDIGYYSANGEIIILGRKDDQIKIHGNRVELSEISNAIEKISGVEKAITIFDKDMQQLSAYLILKKEVSDIIIRSRLSKLLPNYMIPHKLYTIDSFPVNNNNKIDYLQLKNKAHLLKSVSKFNGQVHDKREISVIHILVKVLGIENVDLNYSFMELGGNSLQALQAEYEFDKIKIAISAASLLEDKSIYSLLNRSDNKQMLERNDDELNFEYYQYRNCFYSTLFKALGDTSDFIYPILAQQQVVYNLDFPVRNKDMICYIERQAVGEILKEYGVLYREYNDISPEFIIDFTRQELNKGRKVITWVHYHYKQGTQDDAHPHTILLTGYNETNQCFEIICNKNYLSPLYLSSEIKKEIFKQYYCEFIEGFKTNNPLVYVIKTPLRAQVNWKNRVSEIYLDISRIEKGFPFFDTLKQMFYNLNKQADQMVFSSKMVNALSLLCNAKYFDFIKLQMYNHVEISSVANDIYKMYVKLRNVFLKSIYKNTFVNDLEKIISMLDVIQNLEKKQLSLLKNNREC